MLITHGQFSEKIEASDSLFPICGVYRRVYFHSVLPNFLPNVLPYVLPYVLPSYYGFPSSLDVFRRSVCSQSRASRYKKED